MPRAPARCAIRRGWHAECPGLGPRTPTAIAGALLLIGSDIPKVQLIAQRIKATGKVACRDIAAGAWVRKYGEVIGVATTAILASDHVHVHNIRSVRT